MQKQKVIKPSAKSKMKMKNVKINYNLKYLKNAIIVRKV